MKKIKKNLIYLIIVEVLLFSCSCHKEPLPSPTPRLIPAELKAYWDFKPGTWWVYMDSTTKKVDTVKVINRKNYRFWGVINLNQQKDTCEYLEIDTYNSGDGYNYNYWINTSAAGSSYTDYNVVYANKFDSTGSVDTHKNFVYPLLIGNATYYSYGTGADDSCIIKNIYPNFLAYNNVIEVLETINKFENGERTITYYAKNVGRVRYVIPAHSTVKSLIAYNVIQ